MRPARGTTIIKNNESFEFNCIVLVASNIRYFD